MYLTFAKWAVIILAVVGAIALLVGAIALLVAAIGVLTGKGDQMSKTFSSMSGAAGSMTGGMSSSGRSAAAGIPGFASGGVFAPDSPMLAVFGDNKTEYEVAAPESTLRDVFTDVLDDYSGFQAAQQPRSLNLTMTMDGKTFARIFLPYLKSESARLGPDILNR